MLLRNAVAYIQALVASGNEDLCYYNFECARPLGIFTAFNNIISNAGYVLLGVLFLASVAHRDLLHRHQRKFNPVLTQVQCVFFTLSVFCSCC
ncbi:unnamed protein product [Dicrocoelium dendriticum]|nr:unnamed protein product [Dicrocoelium dendriticum]